ncbi:DNA polymerase III subunit delta [Methyloglobulus morosus KoM1]|uniref:DNA polymerase III subunit delta n=1 Tax=Methyloglobulus morosus KoM1 TaxID=1116472 RepID=V5BZF4_9GAMM|nr:DNA polymerase III subunit delta [Methyloglobulus morosus]ESS73204.1 DNA polymerase III subunit delta [Methyloglobulus morosus KoM1]
MQIKPQQLAGALQKNIAPVYYLSGDEPQQLGELADAIRQSAKQQEYTSREIFFADKAFDWKQLSVSADNYSIFADKKILDLRLPSGTLGTDGVKALTTYCQHLPEDTLLLVTAGKITKDAQKSSWFQAIDKVGCIVQVWPLTGQELLRWIQDRLQQRGITAEPGAVKILADRMEGNLLAAAQEIEKLYVLFGAGKLNTQQILDVVADNSRYDVFKLVESALTAQPDKVLKILFSLKAEGIASAIVLWALMRETRILISYKAAQSQGEKELILKKNGVWGERKQLIDSSSKRLTHPELNNVLVLGAKADRQIKGQQRGDAWETLLEACLGLGSVLVFGKTG